MSEQAAATHDSQRGSGRRSAATRPERRDNSPEDGGSTPSPLTKIQTGFKHRRKWKVEFRHEVGTPGHEYLRRTMLETPWGSVRIHEWTRGDDARAFHDHPWDFWHMTLRGRLGECTPSGLGYADNLDFIEPFHARRHKAEYQHTVIILENDPTTTLLITGPVRRQHYFYRRPDMKRYRPPKWFAQYGHH